MKTTFKITKPHAPECGGIGWYFPNGWRGVPTVEQRDRAGRARGKRDDYMPDWLVLACNDRRCNARSVVPVEFVLRHADESDPSVNRRNQEDQS